MEISASLVKDLRERTGAGLMDCKKALTETEGDLAKAIEWLQIKGMAKAAKKADRVAADGLVGAYIAEDGTRAALVEINCETDFVARNDDFVAFVRQIARHIVDNGIETLDALLASHIGNETVEEIRKAKVATIGENVSIRRLQLLRAPANGVFGAYLHGGGSIGVVTLLSSDKSLAGNADASALAKDICMHIAASNPMFVRQSDVDAEVQESQKRIFTEQAMESGKPKEIAEKMVVGRLAKWRQEICLLDQPFVKNPDLTVAKHVEAVGASLGAKLGVVTFARFVRGEGIEKKEANFAEEVAAMSKG